MSANPNQNADAAGDVLALAGACEGAVTLEQLERVWRDRMGALGFSCAALGAHVDPLRPDQASYVFHTYPEAWVRHFSVSRYHLIDPVLKTVEAGAREFDWTDSAFIQSLTWRQKRVLMEAREFGLRFGRTHALASTVHLKASGSFVSPSPDVDGAVYAAAKIANVLVHHRAAQLCAGALAPAPQLSRRERQCLELCAGGLNDLEVAQALDISASTVRRHLEGARRRLGASSRIVAAVRAIQSGQIKLKS